MLQTPLVSWRTPTLTALALGLVVGLAPAAEPPQVRELCTQKVGDTTYFHVRFDAPADMRLPRLDNPDRWWASQRPELARLPQLIPQDEQTRAVYPRLSLSIRPDAARNRPGEEFARYTGISGLEFTGKLHGAGEAKFLLVYPTETPRPNPEKDKDEPAVARLMRKHTWAEMPVTLDFRKATAVVPQQQAREHDREPALDDLEGLWASGQAAKFAVLEAQSPEFGFYSFARQATARKYRVPAPAIAGRFNNNREMIDRQLYETTTGAAAIAESLQLQRMLNANAMDPGKRTVDITRVPGIDIREHPWEQMMAGRKPAPEPLAKLVPHDNFYLRFKSIRKFTEFGNLMDQWGSTLARAYEVKSQDHQLKERLEKQICIKSTWVGKTFGPAIIDEIVITGSDMYLREGSDLTVIFSVSNKKAFLLATDKFIADTRKEFGDQLKEDRQDYQGVTIESFVTPLREVSLYRAVVDQYIIYSNSPVAVRRVLDTQQGKRKALADSLDFQYMRTVFRADDPEEDGFVFLSDAFIRQLVGPASKIKEKRRLEALTSLYMTTHAALFAAWESGKLPEDHKALLAASGLQAHEIYTPEGKGVTWDGTQKVAISDVYNTHHFATPLVELPIDFITPAEEREYLQFRAQYMGLWRQYFDPIGIRVAMKDTQLKIDTYILPLIQNSEYNRLRERTGGGTATLNTAEIAPNTILQFMAHISPNAPERNELANALNFLGGDRGARGLDWLGSWFLIRLDDSPIYARMAELWLRHELDPESRADYWQEELRLFFQIPLTVGVEIRNPLVFAGVLAAVKKTVADSSPDDIDWEPMMPPYKGVTIVKIQAKPRGQVARWFNENRDPKEPVFTPAIYYASVDGGWYASLSEASLKEIIDRSVARKEGKEPDRKGETVQINSSIYVAPQAAIKTKDFLRFYLEWETHRRALGNAPLLYSLVHSGVVPENATGKDFAAASLKYFGFVPVSPDEEAYFYNAKTDEVVNARHGSPRHPKLQAGIEKTAPLGRLLEEFQNLRADLRFREDGIHTVITIERAKP